MLLKDILSISNVGKEYYDEETGLVFEVQYSGTLEFICVRGDNYWIGSKVQDLLPLSKIVGGKFYEN